MKCEFCLNDIPDNSKFCAFCGRPTDILGEKKGY